MELYFWIEMPPYLRLGVNNSSLLCIAEVSRKDAEPLRFRNGSTCGRVKASSIQHPGSSIASYFGASEATICSCGGTRVACVRSNLQPTRLPLQLRRERGDDFLKARI